MKNRWNLFYGSFIAVLIAYFDNNLNQGKAMNSKIKKMIAGVSLALSASLTQAMIIDHDTYLTDTDSGMDWLDVTTSLNRSYIDVSAQFGSGGDFEGWRYATRAEFHALLDSWTGYTSDINSLTSTTGSTPSVDGLVSMLGATIDPAIPAVAYVSGFLADTKSSRYRYAGFIYDRESYIPRPRPDLTINAYDFYSSYNSDEISFSHEYHGSFLVRGGSPINPPDPIMVSEPNSLALLGLGLFGLRFARKRRQA